VIRFAERVMEANVYPDIGATPLRDVTSAAVQALLHRVEARDATSLATTGRGLIGQVLSATPSSRAREERTRRRPCAVRAGAEEDAAQRRQRPQDDSDDQRRRCWSPKRWRSGRPHFAIAEVAIQKGRWSITSIPRCPVTSAPAPRAAAKRTS
jgi:hypothetical protein